MTSSPHYHQSDESAEAESKSIILCKNQEDPYLVLLSYRNNHPDKGFGPAELTMSRLASHTTSYTRTIEEDTGLSQAPQKINKLPEEI